MNIQQFKIWVEKMRPVWEKQRQEREKEIDRYYDELGAEMEKHPILNPERIRRTSGVKKLNRKKL